MISKISLFFLCFWPLLLLGQAVPFPNEVTPPDSVIVRKIPTDWMQAQIKTVGEFVERYNAACRADRDGTTRRLRALFDETDSRLKPAKTGAPTLYSQRVQVFLEQATDTVHALPRRPALLARVDFLGKQNGQGDTLRVYLQKRYSADSAAYWQVIGANLFPTTGVLAGKAGPARIKNPLTLPPNAHEVAFLPLLHGLRQQRSLFQFAPAEARLTPQEQMIESALQSGQLTVQTPVRTTIYLPMRSGWLLQLDEFVRESANSGWLITDLYQKNDLPLLATPLQMAFEH